MTFRFRWLSACIPAVLTIAVVCAGGAAAEDPGGLVPPDVAAAAGWLGWAAAPVAGKGCTAVLVAPDAVLTAAHCVTRDPAAALLVPKGLIFAPGWGGDLAQPVRRAIRIDLPAPRQLLGGRLTLDLALVTLDAPVAGIAPLPPADAGEAAPHAILLGYAVTDPDHIHVADCARTLEEYPVLGFDCPAVQGFSGGPVVVATEGGWRLAAVIVARGKGAGLTGTYAVTVPGDLLPR